MYIVIMGGGKVGEYLASVLLGKGHEVAVLESDRDTADHLSVELQGEYLIINGDGCDSDFQEDAGIRKADVFVAVTGRDDDNLVACEIATRVFNVNRCIARVNNPKNLRIFREAGIELEFKGEGMDEVGIDKATGKVVIEVSKEFYRPTDVVNLWGDPTKAKSELGWNPTKTTFEELVKIMVKHDMELVAKEN